MGNLVEHAKREFQSLGNKGDDWMESNVISLIELFGNQGHSGGSAPYCIGLFNKLASFEPLCPLTGSDDEWIEVSDGIQQNIRCGRVFKENGQAYDIDGKVFREPDGHTYTSIDSRVPVTFPYTPTTEYVDVESSSA